MFSNFEGQNSLEHCLYLDFFSKAVKKEKLLDDCVRNFVKIASSADLKDEENQKADNRNKKSFEFPSGYTHTFGFERFQIAESLFTPEGML